MPILNCRVDADLAARFHQLCADRDTTVTEVLRQAITAFVERDMQVKRERESVTRSVTVATSRGAQAVSAATDRPFVSRLDKSYARSTMKGSK